MESLFDLKKTQIFSHSIVVSILYKNNAIPFIIDVFLINLQISSLFHNSWCLLLILTSVESPFLSIEEIERSDVGKFPSLRY